MGWIWNDFAVPEQLYGNDVDGHFTEMLQEVDNYLTIAIVLRKCVLNICSDV